MKPAYKYGLGAAGLVLATAFGTAAFMSRFGAPQPSSAPTTGPVAASAPQVSVVPETKPQQVTPSTGPSHISLICDVSMTRYDADGRPSTPKSGEITFNVDVRNNKVTNMAGEKMAARIGETTIEYGGIGRESTDFSGRKLVLTKQIKGSFDRISGELSEVRSGQSQVDNEEPVSLGRVETAGQCKPQAPKF